MTAPRVPAGYGNASQPSVLNVIPSIPGSYPTLPQSQFTQAAQEVLTPIPIVGRAKGTTAWIIPLPLPSGASSALFRVSYADLAIREYARGIIVTSMGSDVLTATQNRTGVAIVFQGGPKTFQSPLYMGDDMIDLTITDQTGTFSSGVSAWLTTEEPIPAL
jgi:hypothetical protein